MKSCPTCNRTYSDETLAFCLVDGSILSAPFDPDERRQRPATPERSPVTEVLSPPTVRPEMPPAAQSTLHVAAPPAPVFHEQRRQLDTARDVAGPSILLRLAFVLRGLCAIVFGIFAIWQRDFYGLGRPFVIYAFFIGALGIICGVKTHLDYGTGWLFFVEGAFNLGAAVVLYVANYYTAYSLLIPPGCMIVGGIFQMGTTFQLRKQIGSVWPLALSGATSFLSGAALFVLLIFARFVWVL